jgi:hypothetical protein
MCFETENTVKYESYFELYVIFSWVSGVILLFLLCVEITRTLQDISTLCLLSSFVSHAENHFENNAAG